jgi:hypothetical protein
MTESSPQLGRGDLVEYVAQPVFDLMIKPGETGIVERVEDGWVYADWPRSGVHGVPLDHVTARTVPSVRDDLVREIVRLGGKDYLDHDPTNLLTADYVHTSAALIDSLTELRDRLKSDAIERGWDVE